MVQKSFGGDWITPEFITAFCEKQGGCETWPQMDGVKNICMDRVHNVVTSSTCVVYSFGLSDDWTFEENFARLGCKVN